MTAQPRASGIAVAALAAIFLEGQAPVPPAPVERIRAERRAADLRVEGRLVMVRGRQTPVTRRFTWKVKAFPSALAIQFVVTEPADDRLAVMARVPDGGRPAIEVARPGGGPAVPLPPGRWGDPLFDTVLGFEDLLDWHYDWERQSALGVRAFGSRVCDLVRSEPTPGDLSAYGSVVSWIAQDVAVPVYVEKTLVRGGAAKSFTYSGIRRSKGVWGARQVEIRLEGVAEPTLLILSGGSARANLSAADFDPTRLWRSARQ